MAPSLYDVIRVVAKMSQAANDIINVYYLGIEGTTPPSNSALLASIVQWLDDAYAYVAYAFADNLSFDTIDVFNRTANEFVGTDSWPTQTVGGGGVNPMLPPQTAPLVLFPTTVPKSVCKKFLPVCTDNVLDDDGTPVAGLLTNMLSYSTVIADGIDEGAWQAVYGAWSEDVFTFNKVTGAVARDLFATQRSRYTGSGT